MVKEENIQGSQPNIVLIVSDDHGYGDLGFREELSDIATPNLDRLRASGMLLEQGYVSAPICSPSRTGLMVGSYQQRWGAKWFDSSKFAPEPYLSIPEVLKQAGYRSGYFGKVHYGPDQPGTRACPDQHGFDESFYGLAALSMGRLHYLKHEVAAEDKFGKENAERNGFYPMYHNGEPVDCHTHLTVEFANRAIDFIDESLQAEMPYFCMVAFNAVHNFAWQLPDDELRQRNLPAFPDFDEAKHDYYDWYDGVIMPHLENGRDYYLAQLDIMDREIGRILDKIEAAGEQENTLIIYLTDNGGSPCNYGNNAPLFGTKYSLYEGGVRIPFIASWPGVVEANSQSRNLVSSLDLLPTFAYLAGGELINQSYPTDGKNIIPTLLGQDGGHKELYFDTGFQWSVRDQEWKLRTVSGEEARDASRALKDTEHADIGYGTSLVPIGQSLDESDEANQATDRPDLVAYYQKRYEQWAADVYGTTEESNNTN
ncbi:sulfatase family protein [Dolosigranulum pigrum]|uniref:sulfatase family protein n=2 Tax=Dolosigranulum pigrum TaxID=29394 RepID=UPI000DBF42DB|nr:sulfatase-like hydrolase/transferase [Dolosigranulum pigrum]QTJ51680.1 arylsulfatase [Dolosigranulum pigrum]RAN58844.1 arylsulfatase [Dolosigranulum pigrum]